jgi:ubiquinol-cytochrome c reductase cytochrome b subunit
MPNWEWHIGSTTWSWNVAIPGLGLMGLFFGLMAIYPFIEAWVTGDKSEHHVLDRPRNNPTRTAFGVAAMTGYAMLWIGGGNDLVAVIFDVSLNAVTYFLRVAVFVAPVLAFLITKRICIGLQHSDRDRMLHGAEAGVIDRAPSGKYSERHRPISEDEAFTLTQHADIPALLPATETDGYSEKEIKREQLRRKATRFYFIDTLRRPTRAEIEEAEHHHLHPMIVGDGEHHAIEPEEEHHLAK